MSDKFWIVAACLVVVIILVAAHYAWKALRQANEDRLRKLGD